MQAAQVTSLASTLAGVRSEVVDLESSKDALREKVSSLHDAVALREHHRAAEALSLRESLLSAQVGHVVRIREV